MEPVIETRKLTKRYDGIVAVDELDLMVGKGSVTALLGGNGAGKTTTLSMLLGLLTPSSGEIFIFGEDFLGNRFRALSRMNFSSPYVDLPQRLTVRQNLNVYAKLYGFRNVAPVVDRLARDFDLTDFLDRRLRRLSSGQKTRVSLAKAFVNEPDLLLLDEPTASLDPETASWIRDFLKSYCKERGATILLASHDMREVELICDDVLLLRRGKLVERGSPVDLLKRFGRKTLDDVFLDVARGQNGEAA
ncbi:MAG: ABC transporter ATP-binding protein [Verrucomicrobia bacterium]|nr:ABC transporter ATP-binding protein [Verrucomicrobiota bacterium]